MYLVKYYPASRCENILGVFDFREVYQMCFLGYTYERNQELDFQIDNHFKLIPSEGENPVLRKPLTDFKPNHAYFNTNCHVFLNYKQIKKVANMQEDDEVLEFDLEHEGFILQISKVSNLYSENEDWWHLKKIATRKPFLIHRMSNQIDDGKFN